MKRTIIILLCVFITGLSFQVQARKYKGLSIGANSALTTTTNLILKDLLKQTSNL